MNDYLEQLEYIKNQLIWIKSKVELDNQLSLYDINKLGEDIFMHMLNDVYDFNLKNANQLQENFPAIDLVDDRNKIVIQVTSTITAEKVRTTIAKFKQLSQYSEYKLKFFYLKEKPSFQKNTFEEFEEDNITSNDLLGIEDIIGIVQGNPEICKALYKTIQQRMDSISFKFNIDLYFELAEPHLNSITDKKFESYNSEFKKFIGSDIHILEVHSVGGNGKSHLLRCLSKIETKYIPLIFTKQINIEDDLSKLDNTKNYLFIFDDIDRFLDQPVLLSLLSYVLQNNNAKLILSYRTASQNAIKTIYRRYTNIKSQEIEVIWDMKEIESLIHSLLPELKDDNVKKLAYTFNNNPYLITQALKGDIKSVQEFSNKTIDDVKIALKDFNIDAQAINDLLFELSLLTPISKQHIPDDYKEIINRLVERKVLRELASKYRFNPDMLGDLFLANYIDENKESFSQIVENNLQNFSDNVFTNLSYALVYNQSDSLQKFIKTIIQKWIDTKDYNNKYLALINKIVYFAPMESFVYLKNATKYLNPKKTNALGMDGVFSSIVTTYSPADGDWTSDSDAINLESIEPIVAKLIDMLKNNYNCDDLGIEHIINYLTSDDVLRLPKPYYDNQTLSSIFKKLVSPLNTTNFETILTTLNIVDSWLVEEPLNNNKISLLQDIIKSLLNATFENNYSEGMTYYIRQTPLNIEHPEVLKIIHRSKQILSAMLENNQTISIAIDCIQSIGGRDLESLSEKAQSFYNTIKNELLEKVIELLKKNKEYFFLSKVEKLAINILNFHTNKEIALKILETIDRSNEYILYQMVIGVDFLIIDFDAFYTQYVKQDNIKDWMFDSIYRMDKHDITDDEHRVIESLSKQYTSTQQLIDLLNKLNMDNWNSYDSLLRILKVWFSTNDTVITDICKNHLNNIKEPNTINVLKELSLDTGIVEIDVDDIKDTSTNDELKVYISSIFKKYTSTRLDVLEKIMEQVAKKPQNAIRMFIAIISQKIYFQLAKDAASYSDFESMIIQFFEWQIQYNFNIESYLTHHSLEIIKDKYGISDDIRDKLMSIIKKNEIQINEFDLKAIYRILDLTLVDLLQILFDKLTSKKEDGYYRHFFSQYFDSDGLTESLLIKEYINSYEDFTQLVTITLNYYDDFTEYGEDKEGNKKAIKINLDYFLKFSIKQEYLEKLFSNLIKNAEIEKIKILYKIIPIRPSYFNLIVKILNVLEDEVDDIELMHFLTEVGKIKSWTRSHMENSPELLSEEALLEKISETINSLSLKLKIQEELKYIELRKKQEIEEDIEHLLDK